MRTTKHPWPLNQFPVDFGNAIAKHAVYMLATQIHAEITADEWGKMFADSISAKYQPCNAGLGDFISGNTAWSAKTVWTTNPKTHQTVKLSYGSIYPDCLLSPEYPDVDPQLIGDQVLQIWNERVNAVRSKFLNLRAVVLVKSKDLTKLAVFEFETVFYPPEQYVWQANDEGNLEGLERSTRFHKFTWQPHGSQFTIIEPVPDDCLHITVKQPPRLDREEVLKAVHYDESWITVSRRK